MTSSICYRPDPFHHRPGQHPLRQASSMLVSICSRSYSLIRPLKVRFNPLQRCQVMCGLASWRETLVDDKPFSQTPLLRLSGH